MNKERGDIREYDNKLRQLLGIWELPEISGRGCNVCVTVHRWYKKQCRHYDKV